MVAADAAFESGQVMQLNFDYAISGLSELLNQQGVVILLFATGDNVRSYSLVLGLFGIFTGFVLMLAHKRAFDVAMSVEDKERVRAFETRKFRRRSTVSSMIAAAGCMLAALFWVIEPKTFSIFILLIMATLIGILGIALIDLFSVSLQSLTRTDDAARKAMIDEYLRQRKKSAFEDPEEK